MQETAAVSVRVRPRFVVATGLTLACALYISQHILQVQDQPPSMTSHVNGSKTPFQRIRFTATSRVGEDARTPIYFRGTAVPNTPVILIWTKLHEYQYTFFLKKPSEELNYTGCPKRCRIIDDRSKLSISDGVVFHGKDINVSDMPRTRLQHQKWVYWSAEPPPLSFPDLLKQLNDTFNWTMSYRLDSDIVVPYGRVLKYKTPKPYSLDKFLQVWKRKPTTAAWAVSNCLTPSKREDYAHELLKHINARQCGLCTHVKCPPGSWADLYQEFSRNSIFYLAFENSICKDYVTEKLFGALMNDIIPVVFGGADYSRVAPPRSFIDALSFPSPKKLANHLKAVAHNFSLYRKYMLWKSTHRVSLTLWPEDSLCSLCLKLHSASFKQRSVHRDVFYWWHTRSQCRKWDRTTNKQNRNK